MVENPFKPGTPLWNMTEVNRRFTDASRPWRQWVESQLKLPSSVDGYPTASPAASLASFVVMARRGGSKEMLGDNFRLHVMGALIDAGVANTPTEAVAKLREAGGWKEHQLRTAADRLVRKYDAPEFQAELEEVKGSPDYQTLVRLLRENRAEYEKTQCNPRAERVYKALLVGL